MRITVLSGLSAGVILAVATACGGTAATQAPPAPASHAAASQAAPAGGAPTCATGLGTGSQVGVANFAFNPATSTVAAGATVSWTNTDSATHTVTFDSGPDCGNLATGASATATFSAAGTYAYHCKIHPQMKGTVTVS